MGIIIKVKINSKLLLIYIYYGHSFTNMLKNY